MAFGINTVSPRREVNTNQKRWYNGSRKLTIAQFTNVYGSSDSWMDASGAWSSCRQPCEALGSYGDAYSAAVADVVVLSLQNFNGVPWTRPANQLWIGSYFESPEHYPSLEDPNIMQHFNLTTGFRPDADLPVFGMVYDTFKDFRRVANYTLPDWKQKRMQGMAMMSVWISNCGIDKTQRMDILDELASLNVSYASYGTCRNTHAPKAALLRLSNDDWRRFGLESAGTELVAVATRHPFFYAAENSNYPYYVTEKVFHGLLAGSVPVYIGDSAHLRVIAPPHSIIYADDFDSIEAMAAHIKAVADSLKLYEEYLSWRQDPQAVKQLERIMALPNWASEHPQEYACALCEYLHAIPKG